MYLHDARDTYARREKQRDIPRCLRPPMIITIIIIVIIVIIEDRNTHLCALDTEREHSRRDRTTTPSLRPAPCWDSRLLLQRFIAYRGRTLSPPSCTLEIGSKCRSIHSFYLYEFARVTDSRFLLYRSRPRAIEINID